MFRIKKRNALSTLSIFGPIVLLLAALILFQYKNYSENKNRLENQLFRQQDLITSLGAEQALGYFKEVNWGLEKLAFSISHHKDPQAYEEMGKAYETLDGKVEELAYFDAAGEKKYSVMGRGALGGLPQNARFEEFFLVPKTTQVPYVSSLTRFSGGEGIFISRLVKEEGGEGFAGVVVARVDRESFSRLCQDLANLSRETRFVNFIFADQNGRTVCQPGPAQAADITKKELMAGSKSSDIITREVPDAPGKKERVRLDYYPLQVEGYRLHLISVMSLSGIDGLMRGDLVFLLISGGFFFIVLLAGGFYFRSVYSAKARAESEAAYSATLAAKGRAVESEKDKLIAVLNSIPDGIMLIDSGGRVTDSNLRMKEIAGPAAAVGGDGRGFPMESLAGPVAGEAEASISGKIYKIISVPLSDKKIGSTKEIRLIRDVTAEKMLEQKKSYIAHMITHDIKSPLTVIIGIAQWLSESKASEGISEDFRSSVETIKRASNRILTLMDNFLFLATVEGHGKIQKTTVNLNLFLARAVMEYQLEAKKKGINLAYSYSDHMPAVPLDETQMMRAVSNLIGNALKYTPEGGEVSVYAKNFRDYVTISVSDSGHGISKDDIPYIFNRYYRSKRTGRAQKGSGLGLAIVKAVIESHGGTVDVVSEEEKGTTFVLRLPLAGAHEGLPAETVN